VILPEVFHGFPYFLYADVRSTSQYQPVPAITAFIFFPLADPGLEVRSCRNAVLLNPPNNCITMLRNNNNNNQFFILMIICCCCVV
jgi:hypothetical protein